MILPLTTEYGPRITPRSSVLCVIPHFECGEWLGDAVESVLAQTRRPDRIVVVDDASGRPPREVVERYPSVTLLETERNVGPYRIVQQVIDQTAYDVYMFQDADDWSAPARLEVLLEAAERSGAELVGSHYCMVHCAEMHCAVKYFPADVNSAFAKIPTWHALQHPTSIVSRHLLDRIGGFATGMRFSGDTEMLRRAAYVALVRNVQQVLYFRRDREGSLTGSHGTGLSSPARLAVRDGLSRIASRNMAEARAGRSPDLSPWRVAPPVRLSHVTGPSLVRRSLRSMGRGLVKAR